MMDLLVFQTRDQQRVEVSHAVIESSNLDAVMIGDHVLRVAAPGGVIQVTLTPEQWGKLVDAVSGTITRKH